MPRTRRPKVKKGELREILEDTLGNLSLAAKRIGVSRPTVYAYIEKYGLWDVVNQAREVLADIAEAELLKGIRAGNERLIEFALRANRPEIYGDRTRTEHSGEVVTRVIVEYDE